MKIEQSNAYFLPDMENQAKRIEKCGRVSYKSENMITDCSYQRFISVIKQNGHESVMEHGNYIFLLQDMLTTFVDWYERAMEDLSINQISKGEIPQLRISGRWDENDKYAYIVSGNARAWRNTIRMAKHLFNLGRSYDERVVLKILYNTFGDDILFSDLFDWVNVEELATVQERFCPMFLRDLTHNERFLHWSKTAYISCSRAVSHELVRHRKMSLTQASQRYCNYTGEKFNGETTVILPEWVKSEIDGEIFTEACQNAENAYIDLIHEGKKPQEARAVLTNSTKTELYVTGTLAEWQHFFHLRCAADADPDMRKVALQLRDSEAWREALDSW